MTTTTTTRRAAGEGGRRRELRGRFLAAAFGLAGVVGLVVSLDLVATAVGKGSGVVSVALALAAVNGVGGAVGLADAMFRRPT